MRRYKPEWVISLGVLFIIAALGLFTQPGQAGSTAALDRGDTAWMLTATALVLLMTPGLSFFYGGMVQRKNVISTMLQSFICMGVVSLLWVTVGFSLAFGSSIGGFIGNPMDFFMFRNVGSAPNPMFAASIPFALFAMFQLKFAIITPALITGSFAERVRFASYLIFVVLFSLLIYCPIAHWTWHPNGFLHKMGVLDFAGGTVVHMSAGFAALAGAIIMGRRKIHLASKATPPANIPFVLLGLGMLWFGWFGFNCGSAFSANESATLAFITTNTASAAAMLGWVLFDAVVGRRPSALGAAVGAVVGLVVITPAAGFVTVGQSVAIGLGASLISNMAAHWKSKSQLDDTLDVFPCHGIGGLVGMIATGIFAKDVGLIYGTQTVFLRHLEAILIVGAYSFIVSCILYKISDLFVTLRVRPEQEEVGLDISQHAETY
ncbi:MAG: ammonia channel protein [Deltaproteobacteria bacterium CG11_big_fil_rev_8_21_14_0_20_47_16]|nr:MAG: ammonia channel protein [Deltaproteobacteria bacterium CG11_big_fil_rev_8_21_14_0_20_47_16]